AGQCDLSEEATAGILHVGGCEAVQGHPLAEPADVIAHQVQLVATFVLGRMYGDLRGRQREDQPAAADVNVAELHDVAKECAIGVGVLAVDDDVRTADHDSPGGRI